MRERVAHEGLQCPERSPTGQVVTFVLCTDRADRATMGGTEVREYDKWERGVPAMDAAVGDLFGELDRLQQLQRRADALLAGVGTLHRSGGAATRETIADLRR